MHVQQRADRGEVRDVPAGAQGLKREREKDTEVFFFLEREREREKTHQSTLPITTILVLFFVFLPSLVPPPHLHAHETVHLYSPLQLFSSVCVCYFFVPSSPFVLQAAAAAVAAKNEKEKKMKTDLSLSLLFASSTI
jgi:hypothetical protein